MSLNKYFHPERLEKFSLTHIKQDFKEIKSNISLNDVIILSILPAILTILMFLQSNIIDSLKLHIKNPSWWQFFTSSFVHQGFSHYWGNISLFFILLFLQIIIISKMKEKRRYFYLSIFTIISFSIISSIFQLLDFPIILPYVNTSMGFSGILAAFIGFTPIFWIEYISRSVKKCLTDGKYFFIILFYFSLSFIIVYYPYHKLLLLPILFGGALVIAIFLYSKNTKDIFNGIISENNTIIYFLLILLPLFFIIGISGLFPIIPVRENGFVDILTHYLGLYYGLIVSFIFFKIKLP